MLVVIDERHYSVAGVHSISDWFKSSAQSNHGSSQKSSGRESVDFPSSVISSRNDTEIVKLQRDLKALQVGFLHFTLWLI